MARHPSTAIKPVAAASSPTASAAKVEAMRSYALAEKAEATRRAYRSEPAIWPHPCPQCIVLLTHAPAIA